MKVHLPTYMGGSLVELETDNIATDEQIVGWIDEYGTITSSVKNEVIGDIVQVKGRELTVLVMKCGVIT